MVIVRTEIEIAAPITICFDLARNIDVHTQTVWKHTREKAVAGVVSGEINGGELVTFEATHLLVRQKLTSKITAFERPYLFVDQMVSGAFKYLKHTHEFESCEGGTRMIDTLEFAAPLGPLGIIAETLVLRRYMQKFLEHRNTNLKHLAEKLVLASQQDS